MLYVGGVSWSTSGSPQVHLILDSRGGVWASQEVLFYELYPISGATHNTQKITSDNLNMFGTQSWPYC